MGGWGKGAVSPVVVIVCAASSADVAVDVSVVLEWDGVLFVFFFFE